MDISTWYRGLYIPLLQWLPLSFLSACYFILLIECIWKTHTFHLITFIFSHWYKRLLLTAQHFCHSFLYIYIYIFALSFSQLFIPALQTRSVHRQGAWRGACGRSLGGVEPLRNLLSLLQRRHQDRPARVQSTRVSTDFVVRQRQPDCERGPRRCQRTLTNTR